MRSALAAAASTALVVLVACGTGGSSESQATRSQLTGEVTVFAAASLTEPFTALGKRLEDANRTLTVTLNFAASSALVNQIRHGAQADVFASADEANMRKLARAVEAPEVFARNRLAIVVPKGNPKRVRTLEDLGKTGVIVVLCAAQAPCGTFADHALTRAGVTVRAASREENVKAVLTKVRVGEADAGIVYVTDVEAAGDEVEAMDIPDAHNVVADYPIAVVKRAQNAAAARAFVELVTSRTGSRTLRRFGFMAPG